MRECEECEECEECGDFFRDKEDKGDKGDRGATSPPDRSGGVATFPLSHNQGLGITESVF